MQTLPLGHAAITNFLLSVALIIFDQTSEQSTLLEMTFQGNSNV